MDFKKIINYFSSLDKNGRSDKKVDTYLEYYKLGDYLNGNQSADMTAYNELEQNEQYKLLTIYNNAKNFLDKNLSNTDKLMQIDSNNIVYYENMYNELKRKKRLKQFEPGEEKIFDLLQRSFYQYCITNEYNLEDLEYNECNYNFIIRQISKRNNIVAHMVEDSKVVIDKINNPYENKKLKKATLEFIKENNINPLNESNYDADLGNGKFDKIATQKTELCWAHAGINTLLLTKKGKTLLESNRYYDKSTGIIAIHLEEAEKYGLHGGIYIITPDEIVKESGQLSEGDGDVTAWMIAIKKYFNEMEQNPQLLQKAQDDNKIIRGVNDGNAQFRFFELITGGNANRKNLFDKTRLQTGISYGQNDITFNEIADVVNNQKGAVIIVLGGHAISVVGIQNDNLLVQESNNTDNFSNEFYDKKRQHVIFQSTEAINGVRTYKVSKYDFEHYNFAEAVMKWK